MPDLTLSYLPLPLPWRQKSTGRWAELEQRTSGTDGIRIRAFAENDLPRQRKFTGWVEIAGPLAAGVPHAHCPVQGKSRDEVERECERLAGLFVAALGLERPQGEGGSV